MPLSSLNPTEGFQLTLSLITQMASDTFAILIESKQVHDHVSVDVNSITNRVLEMIVPGEYRTVYASHVSKFNTASILTGRIVLGQTAAGSRDPAVLLRNVRLFCAKCNVQETFAPSWYRDVAEDRFRPTGAMAVLELPLRNSYQLFTVSYECQGCKGTNISFEIRRHRWEFILEGRSPMEAAEVPTEIHKLHIRYFKDAVLARQAGNSMAAILCLRAFLEVFAQRQTAMSTDVSGAELMRAYASLIPAQKLVMMPSLERIERSLSLAISQGYADDDLFNQAAGEIQRHFELRRLLSVAEESTSSPFGEYQHRDVLQGGYSREEMS